MTADAASTAGSARLVDGYDGLILDLDGVVYVGDAALPGAVDAISEARSSGLEVTFATNNASRTPEMVAGQLVGLGIDARADQVVTSAQAAAGVLARTVEAGSRVLVVGGEGLCRALEERGLVPVSSADDDPVAVVQGFAPELGWSLLAEGAYALATGLPWIASNLDLTIPTARGIAPGTGRWSTRCRSLPGADRRWWLASRSGHCSTSVSSGWARRGVWWLATAWTRILRAPGRPLRQRRSADRGDDERLAAGRAAGAAADIHRRDLGRHRPRTAAAEDQWGCGRQRAAQAWIADGSVHLSGDGRPIDVLRAVSRLLWRASNPDAEPPTVPSDVKRLLP